MKKILLIIIIMLSISSTYAQHENILQAKQNLEEVEAYRIAQNLINHLEYGRYFEAKKLYDTIIVAENKTKDINVVNSFIVNYYSFFINILENKPDSVVFYGQKMTQNELINNTGALSVYFIIYQTYMDELNDYEKAIQTCHNTKDFLDRNANMFDDKFIQEIERNITDKENQAKQKSIEPTIKIKRNNTSNAIPILNDTILESLLHIDVSYNNHKLKTVFDTGVTEFFFVDKNEAEKIGVKKCPIFDNNTITINGIQTFGYYGIIDSIQIANIQMYNIPVGVFDFSSLYNYNIDSMTIDSIKKKNIESIFKSIKIVLGLKAMNLIGKFVLDYENSEIYFPVDDEYPMIYNKKNIFRYLDRIYTQVELNKIPLTVDIDTGSSGYFIIDTSFYHTHEPYISVDTISKTEQQSHIMIHKICVDTFDVVVKEPNITFNGKTIELAKTDTVTVFPFGYWGLKYSPRNGIIGIPFIKSLGKKVLFDLRNMRLEVLKDD